MDGIIKIMRPITIYQQQKNFLILMASMITNIKFMILTKKTFH